VVFVEHLRLVMQDGLDGLTTGEPTMRPTVEVIRRALLDHPVPRDDAEAAARDARVICQSQDRAPNIAGLFAQRLADYARKIDGATA